MTYEELMNSSVDDFSNEELQTLWEELLNILDITNGTSQKDINGSLIKTIDKNADLKDSDNSELGFFDSIQDFYLKEIDKWDLNSSTGFTSNVTDYVWNESLSKALVNFINNIDPDGIAAWENQKWVNPNTKEEIPAGIYVDENGNVISDLLFGAIDTTIEDNNGTSFRISDLKEADAGKNFVSENRTLREYPIKYKNKTIYEVINPWVVPWYNVNGDSYSKVRGNDKIEEVLSNKEELQFTRQPYSDITGLDYQIKQNLLSQYFCDYTNNIWVLKDYYKKMSHEELKKLEDDYSKELNAKTYKDIELDSSLNNIDKNELNQQEEKKLEQGKSNFLEKWIRLIMPKNSRFVEVEDLNRNFWVIGQTLAAVSSYLFGDNAPYAKAAEDLLSEVVQLWENILYLWANLASLIEKPHYSKIHTEAVYIPNSEFQSFFKYDNFDNTKTEDLSTLKNRLDYLVKTYTDCNLCILPIIRENNYEENYYSKSVYPYVLLYNRNTDKWQTEIPLISDGSFWNIDLATDETLQNKIYAINEQESIYDYYSPLNSSFYEETPRRFYGLLREEILIESSYSEEKQEVQLNSLTIYIKDIGRQLIGKDENLVKEFNYLNATLTIKDGNFTPDSYDEINSVDISQGYYQGELISYYKVTNTLTYTLNFSSLKLIPLQLGNSYEFSSLDDLKANYTTSNQQKSDQAVLEAYINSDYIEHKNNLIQLFYGDHSVQYNLNGSDTNIYKYWVIENGELKQLELKNYGGNSYGFAAGCVLKVGNYNSIYYKDYYNTNSNSSSNFATFASVFETKNEDGKNIITSYKGTGSGGGNQFSQLLLLLKDGDTRLTKDNWCVTHIDVGIGAYTRLYTNAESDFNFTERTYLELSAANRNSKTVYDSNNILNNNDWWISSYTALRKTLTDTYISSFKESNPIAYDIYTAIKNNGYPFLNLTDQVTISVFKANGEFAQRVWIRQGGTPSTTNYGKWVKATEREISNVDLMRTDYKVWYNNYSGYNWEKFKSNGLYIPNNDDTNSYNVNWYDNVK